MTTAHTLLRRLPFAVGCVACCLLAIPDCSADDGADHLAQPLAAPSKLNDLPRLFHADFEADQLDRWHFTDKTAWRIEDQGNNRVLRLLKDESDFQPPVRSPLNRAIVSDLKLGNCILDVRLQTTTRDYPHRSLCLFFGYQDEAHFYYVHFGQVADDHANQVFIVNGTPREKISQTTNPGTKWDSRWHHARIVRNVDSGRIEVYFDDMNSPAMTAVDKTFRWGQVGVGSFDDTGNFDHVLVFGEEVESTSSDD